MNVITYTKMDVLHFTRLAKLSSAWDVYPLSCHAEIMGNEIKQHILEPVLMDWLVE